MTAAAAPETAGGTWKQMLLDRLISAVVGALIASAVSQNVTGDKLHAIDLKLERIETVVCANLNCPR